MSRSYCLRRWMFSVSGFMVIVGGLFVPDVHAAVPAPPGTVVIDFDDMFAPCSFGSTIRLTNEYVETGVFFIGGIGNHDGGAVLNECAGFGVTGHSSPNFLAFDDSASLPFGTPTDPETVTFDLPVSYVSILAGGNGIVTMDAFDSSGTLVESSTVATTNALTPVTVSGLDIKHVVISHSAPAFVLDDLTFAPAFCPERFDSMLGDFVAEG